MTYGWMLIVVAIVGGGIYGAVQDPDSEYDVTVDGYLTHDGERAELGYVEIHNANTIDSCSSILDASTSATESKTGADVGDISFEFQTENSTEIRFCSASDFGMNDSLVESASTRIPHLIEKSKGDLNAEFSTEGYTIVVEDVTIEPVGEVKFESEEPYWIPQRAEGE